MVRTDARRCRDRNPNRRNECQNQGFLQPKAINITQIQHRKREKRHQNVTGPDPHGQQQKQRPVFHVTKRSNSVAKRNQRSKDFIHKRGAGFGFVVKVMYPSKSVANGKSKQQQKHRDQ